jgi:hypothetical protein
MELALLFTSEAWLRWAHVDQSDVRDPRGVSLVQIVTRQALNRLRTLSRDREDYISEWLPAIERRGRALHVSLSGPPVGKDVEHALAVRVADAVRAEHLPHTTLDVSYHPTES